MFDYLGEDDLGLGLQQKQNKIEEILRSDQHG